MNKFGRKGLPINWDAVKSLWVAGQSSQQIAKVFGIKTSAVECRAKRGKWRVLRNAHKAGQMLSEIKESESKESDSVAVSYPVVILEKTKRMPGELASDQEILTRAITLGDSVEFRQRVIKANDKALKVLESSELTNIGEVDRFAEALTKVERIGARSFGYDREANTPAVNIAVLTAGNEYSD